MKRTPCIPCFENLCSFVVERCHDAAYQEPLLATEEPSWSSMGVALKVKSFVFHFGCPEKKKAGRSTKLQPAHSFPVLVRMRLAEEGSAPSRQLLGSPVDGKEPR